MIPELRPLGQVLGSSTRAIPGALVESSTTPSSGRQERSVWRADRDKPEGFYTTFTGPPNPTHTAGPPVGRGNTGTEEQGASSRDRASKDQPHPSWLILSSHLGPFQAEALLGTGPS